MRNIKDRQVRGKYTLKFKLGRERRLSPAL